MGYHAPDAEDVYRYIFRLDRHSQQSLCDGFSWSILFVNDGSSVCREFLSRYGAELCYRTADRIRFVFFSGLESDEMQHLVNQANSQRGVGFLASIIREAVDRISLRNRYDLEQDPWELLRPDAFHPLDSQERISRHLSMECEIKSAMPGSKEALRLAQKLGIGRFVPCFLLFSDVGSPTIHLFPVADRTPEQVFERLRGLIDSFYEINNGALEHWAKVETSIKEACRKFRTPIVKVGTWKREQAKCWKVLQRLSSYLLRLTNADPSSDLVKEISTDWKLPLETRNLVNTFLNQLESIEQRQGQAKEVLNLADSLHTATDPQLILKHLYQFRYRHGTKLPESSKDTLNSAISLFKPINQPLSAESQLDDWWRSDHGRFPSRKRNAKYRAAWADYSKLKYGKTAIGNVADILKDEFAIILRTTLAQPVNSIPENAANEVLLQLASHLEVPSEDVAWNECVSNYRQFLTEYFAGLKSHAPSWMLDKGSLSSPIWCWGDCIPFFEQRQKAGREQRLEQLPRLKALVQEVMLEWDATVEMIEAKRREQQQHVMNKLSTEIDQWLSSVSLLDADKQSLWFTLISSLSVVRQDLENKTFANAQNVTSAAYPGEIFSRKDASDLLRLLDDYDKAVASVRFPFETDAEMLRVALDTSLFNASEIPRSEPPLSAVKRAKTELIEAVTNAEKSVAEWEAVKNEASAWSPVGLLCTSLSQIVNTSRWKDLLSGLEAKSLDAAIQMLTTRHQVSRLLDALSVQELLALERHLYHENPRNGKVVAATKQELYDSILVAIGLLPPSDEGFSNAPGSIAKSKVDSLKEKVKRGAFDVFLAHNSQDKAAVLRLGQQLRDQGIYPWIDVEQTPPGQWFQDVIQSAVRTVKTAAILMGSSGLGRWQAVELRVFISRCVEHGIPLIPVLLPGAEEFPNDLAFLRELNFVKFTNSVTEESGISRLVWGITGEKP